MLFNSYPFIVFFSSVLLLYFLVPKKIKLVWLLIASYMFYMMWNPGHIMVLLFTTGISWGTGLLLQKEKLAENRLWKKSVMAVSMAIVLGILVFFRSTQIASIAGISFFSFQAAGYIADTYRGKVQAEKNLGKYALYLAFFPKLTAGPIEKSDNFLQQIKDFDKTYLWESRRIVNGFTYMLYGYFMKLVLADNIAVFVDLIFDNYYFYGGVMRLLAAVSYSLQIYFDFAGYSAIAIGAAQIMGFGLLDNFNAPYMSGSIQEFWKRWHISLNIWFRDYVYIPLGGNRKGKWKQYRNLMAVFLLSGLWHGINWTFLVWGGLHALFQIAGKETEGLRNKIKDFLGIKKGCFCEKTQRICITFGLTTFAWIFFRADNLEQAVSYIEGIFIRWDPWSLTDGTWDGVRFSGVKLAVMAIMILLAILCDGICCKKGMRVDEMLESQGKLYQFCGIVLIAMVIFVFGKYGGYNPDAFIYSQF